MIYFAVFTCDYPKALPFSWLWHGTRAKNMLLPPNVQPVFTHSHYTSGIKTKRTLQRGLWCLIILSTSDLYWSLVRALIGVLTPNMPDTGDQKKETTFFFPCFCFVFLMREGDVLHRKSLWVLSIRYDLPLERAFGPFWMNAEPVALVLLYVPVRKKKGWMWVYLCKFYTMTLRCSIIF